jgi:hypothetical protein
MQLIAGRIAQEYNHRKDRQGAFWEDRDHATAIEADEHVHRFTYIYVTITSMIAGLPLRLASRPRFSASWSFSGSVTCSP